MSKEKHLYAGIEGGGTKFLCAVGTSDGEILAEARIPTTTPHETITRVVDFINKQTQSLGSLDAIGVASFGPLDPQRGSEKFGHILHTPKPGWTNTNIVGMLRSTFNVPIGFDTDVNGAALGERRWGAAQDLDTFIYLTIGTGIGGGGLINGKLMHGLLHPEMGHIRLPHDLENDNFQGVCPFHGDCFEGLASGFAMQRRWGQKAETLPQDHPAWILEVHYIALALQNFITTLSPQRIILGGGVMQQGWLFPLIRQKTLNGLNNYIQSPQILDQIHQYIVPNALAGKAGILGAFELAERALG